MDKERDTAYLFAYFTTKVKQIHYGISRNGRDFTALNGGKPVYKPKIGSGGIRDPFIFKGEDGYAYILGTDMDAWRDQSTISIFKTRDYINMEEAVLIDYAKFPGFEGTARAWAPQAIWCPERINADGTLGAYMVYLAMWNKTDAAGEAFGTVMYKNFATDLMDESTYTVPELLFDDTLNGVRVTDGAIDGDIIYDKINDRYIMYYDGRYMAVSDKISGEWTKVTDADGKLVTLPFPRVEGSNIWKLPDEDRWLIAADGTAFDGGCYNVAETVDFIEYRKLTAGEGYSFDFLPRHGYIVTITEEELARLVEEYGETVI
jgi:hypothetical protein